ncbi:SDR family NAD(P)-dependent oxidoreductase [Solirubrobacter sp. CPCC 204708]|uniref:SDR family NAD(P)-dependent oxidoreductase n=1 Tax=Solirubrobacter deserti TaxID=2282478 RepID=A0ABT4RGL1_9ACTN|nr:SDR family NAD(P)-dependent oxidoreductase [Solirubrobacter deserti]MBE2315473.1 SDR family NAD(P)-dependent oxidoreductase [Solirubrobacter deserti]MDA0137685.1 SDR family NAD(P)-dependent oxidoreductase [Solirubrobacter deserti]
MPKTVLVTGASSGIGRAAAIALARRGFTVYAGTRAALDYDGVTPVELDVTRDVSHLRELELDAVVNNAGIAVIGPLEYLPLDELRRQLEVNTVGQLAVIQACLPALRRTRGRIVNVSSISGRVALPLYGPYAASKFALEALSDALRQELRGSVHVSLIEPGAVATPIWQRTLAVTETPPEPYVRIAERLRAMAEDAERTGMPIDVVVGAIHRALTAARPRARYVLGRDARVMVTLARVLPVQAMDRLIARIVEQSR